MMRKVLAFVLLATMTLTTGAVFAAEEAPATEKTDRFTVMKPAEDAAAPAEGEAAAPEASGEKAAAEATTGDKVAAETTTDAKATAETTTDAAVTAEDNAFSMISEDGQLVIHINDKTPVTFEDGKSVQEALEGKTLAELLDGRKLTVTYTIATRSMPPQTSPEKVVVLYEEITVLPQPVTPVVPEGTITGEVLIDGIVVEAPAAYLKDEVVMLPLRAVAEKLGFDVTWDAATRSVRLGNAINLSIGQDYYTVGKMAPITLGTAPQIVNHSTFVPMDFIGTVISGYEASVENGQVMIKATPVKEPKVDETAETEATETEATE